MHLSFTIDGAIIQALDDEALVMSERNPGLSFARTDVLRVVLHNWMISRDTASLATHKTKKEI